MVEQNQTENMQKATTLLQQAKQDQLLIDLSKLAPEQQEILATQIVNLDKVTPVGLQNYCERARKLLEASRNNVNPFAQFKPEVPEGVFLQPGLPEFDQMEAAGEKELSKLCFVLIAGGLGERLGFSGIKVSLPVVTIEPNYSYLKFYAQYALACE